MNAQIVITENDIARFLTLDNAHILIADSGQIHVSSEQDYRTKRPTGRLFITRRGLHDIDAYAENRGAAWLAPLLTTLANATWPSYPTKRSSVAP